MARTDFGGQALLEAAVDRHAAARAPRRSGTDAPAHRGVGRRLADARVVREAQGVVRAQHQHGLAVEQHPRALRPRDQTELAIQPLVTQIVETRPQLVHISRPTPEVR